MLSIMACIFLRFSNDLLLGSHPGASLGTRETLGGIWQEPPPPPRTTEGGPALDLPREAELGNAGLNVDIDIDQSQPASTSDAAPAELGRVIQDGLNAYADSDAGRKSTASNPDGSRPEEIAAHD